MQLKVVINECYGGFGLSDFACEKLIEQGVRFSKSYLGRDDFPYIYLSGLPNPKYCDNFREKDFRCDERLVKLIEKYGSKRCSGLCSKLRVLTLEIEPRIDSLDGKEEFDGIYWREK